MFQLPPIRTKTDTNTDSPLTDCLLIVAVNSCGVISLLNKAWWVQSPGEHYHFLT